MFKNNVEVDVKVKCIEGRVTQAKLAEEVGTSAPYVSRLIRNNEKIVNKTFLQLMEKMAKEYGFFDLVPAMCHLDYTMSVLGGASDFVREYTLASGGLYCDCGYKKKGLISFLEEA